MSHEFQNHTEEDNNSSVSVSLTMWEGRKVAILMPVYRTYNAKTHFSLFACYKDYGPDKIAIPEPVEGTVIHEARNILIHRAMPLNDVETFIMVDDDIVPPCGSEGYFNGRLKAGVTPEQARFNAISRIMSHGKDKEIVGGLYFGRHEYGLAQCEWGFGKLETNEGFRKNQYKGLIEMGWVATGFLKIERTAIDKLKKAIDEGQFPECKPQKGQGWYGYFAPISTGVGEDVSFGLRMKKIGVKSYLDAPLVCLHADGNTLYGPRNTKTPKK
jgi:hypothetical protein